MPDGASAEFSPKDYVNTKNQVGPRTRGLSRLQKFMGSIGAMASFGLPAQQGLPVQTPHNESAQPTPISTPETINSGYVEDNPLAIEAVQRLNNQIDLEEGQSIQNNITLIDLGEPGTDGFINIREYPMENLGIPALQKQNVWQKGDVIAQIEKGGKIDKALIEKVKYYKRNEKGELIIVETEIATTLAKYIHGNIVRGEHPVTDLDPNTTITISTDYLKWD